MITEQQRAALHLEAPRRNASNDPDERSSGSGRVGLFARNFHGSVCFYLLRGYIMTPAAVAQTTPASARCIKGVITKPEQIIAPTVPNSARRCVP